ncbi:hypothetical protein MARCHEWKA_02310 [Brevundimonas phage vB_BpoS-Marchewka]|uniref:Uncharacterized protein n=1 Tax=Brevundimonas phage vB_BpoS-Marchewka TaxID=2948604 RepID=A0A9E7SQV5_9CAUD|nr:hypothetical protein MARCHEWKA_02310 [Brevundimonas phage vB_BpoS-Marchewka]UTC29190.1 hypothetical protein BAMBUS_01080 [Brevundimonas phage vB_BpoS-Bambus]
MTEITDTFRGDNANLLGSIGALLALDATDALTPHGLGGHARDLLSAAFVRISALDAVARKAADYYGAPSDGKWRGLEDDDRIVLNNVSVRIGDIKAARKAAGL